MVDLKLLPETIRLLRKKHGLKQREVADRIDSHRSAYAMYEGGVRTVSLEKLIAIAHLYDMTVDDVLNYSSGKGEEKALRKNPMPENPSDVETMTEEGVKPVLEQVLSANRRLKDELLAAYRLQVKLYRRIDELEGK